MIQVATEKQRMFTEGTRRCFIWMASLTHNYTPRPQGVVLLVD